MSFYYEIDGKRNRMNYDPQSDLVKDRVYLNKYTSGYYTLTGPCVFVLDPEETTLAVLLPTINIGMDSRFVADDGVHYWENPYAAGYIELVRRAGTLEHLDPSDSKKKKRIEVEFIYKD